jgi:hypothetical protein
LRGLRAYATKRAIGHVSICIGGPARVLFM